MKTIKFLAIVAIAVCLASCGGKSESENPGANADSVINALSNAVDAVNDSTAPSISDESESTSDESASESSESASSSSSSEDWDALLDSYEEYVDEYIKLMKKAENGDMSAMTEVASYMEKAQALSNKMANAKGSMSASQVARYTKILNKMASAQ